MDGKLVRVFGKATCTIDWVNVPDAVTFCCDVLEFFADDTVLWEMFLQAGLDDFIGFNVGVGNWRIIFFECGLHISIIDIKNG